MQSLFWSINAVVVRTRRRMRDARLTALAHAPGLAKTPGAFVSNPEPRSVGNFQRGQQMLIGNFRVGETVVEAPGLSIWDVEPTLPGAADLHGFDWMDDLAATGKPGARAMQNWTAAWIERFGAGAGPGWQPDLTGRRLIRLISRAILLMQGQDKAASNAFLRSLARQGQFLSRSWKDAPEGLPRIQALTGLVYVGLALEGFDHLVDPAIRRLGDACAAGIGPDGGVASRAPEQLLDIFTLLNWASKTLEAAGRETDRRHKAALERMAPTLRTVTLGGGVLARFHGGGVGEDGQLDFALADAGIRAMATEERRMGFMRLAAGRSVLVIDAAPPAEGRHSQNAHASTLGFEMTSGAHPLIVSTGPGRWFGERWRRASRATGCHSTLVIEDTSSASIWPEGFVGDTFGERLYNAATRVEATRLDELGGKTLSLSHDGYVPGFGMTHERQIGLAAGGGELLGEDRLLIARADHRRAYIRAQRQPEDTGLRFALHFHIHPDVAASLDLGGTAVSLKLRNDEIWVFRQSGGLIALKDAVYLDQRHVRPRITKQIVVHSLTDNAAATITWSFARAQEGRRIMDSVPETAALAGASS